MFNQDETKCGKRTSLITLKVVVRVKLSKIVVPKTSPQYLFEYDDDLFNIDPSNILKY